MPKRSKAKEVQEDFDVTDDEGNDEAPPVASTSKSAGRPPRAKGRGKGSQTAARNSRNSKQEEGADENASVEEDEEPGANESDANESDEQPRNAKPSPKVKVGRGRPRKSDVSDDLDESSPSPSPPPARKIILRYSEPESDDDDYDYDDNNRGYDELFPSQLKNDLRDVSYNPSRRISKAKAKTLPKREEAPRGAKKRALNASARKAKRPRGFVPDDDYLPSKHTVRKYGTLKKIKNMMKKKKKKVVAKSVPGG